MKKFIVPVFLLLIFASFVFAAVNAGTNLALDKTAYGTFSNPSLVTDGKLKIGAATSGDITDTPQYLTIDLGTSVYLERVKIYWAKNALSNAFTIRTSPDAKYWNEEAANVDAATGVVDNASGTVAISISLLRSSISSRYVQVMVPAGSKVTNPKGRFVSIAEMEVYPSVGQKLTLEEVKNYAVTDRSAIIMYRTGIGAASGTVIYGVDPNKLDRTAINSESGIVNSVNLTGLKSRTVYFYQVKTSDFYGNVITSEVGNFTTSGGNVALNRKVTGTFVAYPGNDKYVVPGNPDEILSRVTDGRTSYFDSMATSGPVPNADQYVVIDLGNTYKIKNILSYWRKLAYPESLTIQVSNNNIDWTTVEDGVDVGSGAFARSEAGDPMKVLNTKGMTGRYLKLLVKQGSSFFHKHAEWNFVQLMEVQVFAE